ncbi:uncharacterized protein LOC133283788 [Gastrolobium bilobum]|uniref:uncharacterized protein LOC133283788 n=1 Tax=Gastrolobium bilobum TaxID=150636 RepID=UPI002AAFE37F|nr:uncharacterized protein LOC133283788 [Gastrolobium bilobum]
MGRPPCCDKKGVKKGPWTPEEDIILVSYIQEHGPGNWRVVPTKTGGQIGQVTGNANIRNRTRRFRSSSSSFTYGRGQLLQSRFYGQYMNLPQESANIVLSNGRGAAVSHHDTVATMQRLTPPSGSLTISPQRFSGSNVLQYQGTTRTIPQSNVDSTAERVGNINPSMNQRNNNVLPIKRSSTDDVPREFLVGESSSMGAAAGTAKRRGSSSNVNVNNNVPVASVSEMQPLSQPAQTENFQSNINVHFTGPTPPEAFAPPNSYGRRFIHAHYETFSFGASSSNPRRIRFPPSVREVHYVSSGNAPPAMMPYYSQGNIQGNVMLGPQVQFGSGTAIYFGNVPHPSGQYASFSGVNASNVPALVPLETPMQISNYPGGRAFAFPVPNWTLLSPSQQMQFSRPVGNSRPENEHNSAATSEIQAGVNSVPLTISSPSFRSIMRRRLMAQARTIVQRLRAGQTLLFQEMMVLDYSVVLHLLEVRDPQQDELQDDDFEEEEYEEENMGLTEEQVMKHIRPQKFVSDETPENKEACCICQEFYVNGEQVGRLDCVHIFHIGCIIGWLRRKNQCPVCKCKGLIIIDEDGDE